jgi:hypothetical protein
MARKVISGLDTNTRIEKTWEDMLSSSEYLTVTEFSKKAGISSSTLYHCYGEWASRVQKRRDSKHGINRRMIPIFSYKNKGESLETIDKLRSEVIKLTKELNELKKENDNLTKIAKDSEKNAHDNERLRTVIIKSFDIIKKYVDSTKAQKIIDDIIQFQNRHLSLVKTD